MKGAIWLGVFLFALVSVWGYAASATPPGWGQEQGIDQPTLNCPSCYQTASPLSGTVAKSGATVKGTMYSKGFQVVPPSYSSFTYAPSWYVGLGKYYRHRGQFKLYNAQQQLGADQGLSIAREQKPKAYVASGSPSYQLVNGKMMAIN